MSLRSLLTLTAVFGSMGASFASMGSRNSVSSSATRLEALNIQSSSYGVTLPVVYGTARVAGNLLDYLDFAAHAQSSGAGGKGGRGSVSSYTYSASVLVGLCEGPITGVRKAWRDKELFQVNTAGESALSQMGLSLKTGALGQAAWSHLTGDRAVPYSGVAYVCGQDYGLGQSATLGNHSWEIVGTGAGVNGTDDADPTVFAADVINNARWGANAGMTTGFTAWANYCRAYGVLMSPALTEQQTAQSALEQLATLTQTMLVWSEDQLRAVPLCDAALTANGVTFTPDSTATYELTDDHFLRDGGAPVEITRKAPSDAYNRVRIEFRNRGNSYATEVVTAEDLAAITAYGLRQLDTITAHWICDPAVARRVAQAILQRETGVRNTYRFRLPITFSRLDPGDLVTLTDAGLGLSRAPVRITSITDNGDDLEIEAEDYPPGVVTATLYPSTIGAGFAHDANAAAPSIAQAVLFEPPAELTSSGLQVWAAVQGGGTNWGGCEVWVSIDGTNYRKVDEIQDEARFGTIAVAVSPSSSVKVQGMTGQLTSGTAAEAAALSTLCFIGGTNPEWLAYQTATLTAAGAYTLTGLVRGAYGTGAQSHAVGDRFIRVDDRCGQSGSLDRALIGKTIYFKFPSFNSFGGGRQSLADATAYSYTVTGALSQITTPVIAPGAATDVAVANVTPGTSVQAYRVWPVGATPDYTVLSLTYTAPRAGTAVLTASGVIALALTSGYTSGDYQADGRINKNTPDVQAGVVRQIVKPLTLTASSSEWFTFEAPFAMAAGETATFYLAVAGTPVHIDATFGECMFKLEFIKA